MKKLILIAFMILGMASQASAYHMPFNPDAGETVPDISPHSKVYF